MSDISAKIEQILQEADECERLGGLAASHEERAAKLQQAEELRALALEAQILLDQSEARMKGPQKSLPI
jgi:hypothetical protein